MWQPGQGFLRGPVGYERGSQVHIQGERFPGRKNSKGRVEPGWREAKESSDTLSLEKEMATPSSTLAQRIPWTEEPGGLPSMESHRVGHD